MPAPDTFTEDPAICASRREAVVVLFVAAGALIYSVTTCYLMGYGREIGDLTFVHLGAGIAFPDWVFWGIIVPWLACFVFGGIFAFGWMQDADLGEELEEDDGFSGSEGGAANGGADRPEGEGHA